jgi:hypothetical protein
MGVALGFDALFVEWLLIFCRNILTIFLWIKLIKKRNALPFHSFSPVTVADAFLH